MGMIDEIVVTVVVVATATGLILDVRVPSRPRHKIAGLTAAILVLITVGCFDRMTRIYSGLPPLQPPELMKALGRWPDGMWLALAAAVASIFTPAKPRFFLLFASAVIFVWFFMRLGFLV